MVLPSDVTGVAADITTVAGKADGIATDVTGVSPDVTTVAGKTDGIATVAALPPMLLPLLVK